MQTAGSGVKTSRGRSATSPWRGFLRWSRSVCTRVCSNLDGGVPQQQDFQTRQDSNTETGLAPMHRVSCVLQYGSYFGHLHVAFGAVDDRCSRERTSSRGAGRSQGNRALASCFANLQGCRAGNMQETQPTPALSPPAPGRSTPCQSTPCQSTLCRAASGPPLGFHTRALPGRGVPAPFWSQLPTGPAAQWPPQPQTTPAGTAGVWAVPLEQTTTCLKCPTKCSRVIKEQTEQVSGSIHILGNAYLEGSHKKMLNSWLVSGRQDKARCG